METGDLPTEKPKSNEVERKSKVHYESGFHPISDSEYKDLWRRLNSGDIDVHHWNSEVGERMHSYQPRVIAIDGLIPGNHLSKAPDYYLGSKKDIWMALPERPSRINNNNEVLVVSGDTLGWINIFESVGSEEIYTRSQNDFGHFQMQDKLKGFGQLGLGLGLALAAGIGSSERMQNVLTNKQTKLEQNKILSRRIVLAKGVRGLLGITAASVLGKMVGSRLSTYSTDEKLSDLGEKIANLTKDRIFVQDWTNGRTAMLIAKCAEGLSQGLVPEGSEGSVLLGAEHTYYAPDYFDDKKARQKVIYKYAKKMTEMMDDVSDKFSEIPKEAAHNAVLDLIARADMAVVTDSGSDHVKKENVDNFMNKNVRYVGSFMTPEILEAVKSLRV